MMRTLKKYTFFLFLTVIFLTSAAKSYAVDLPAIFQNGMILQQNSEAAIWGTTDALSSVRVTTSWNGQSYEVTSDSSGNWRVDVATSKGGFDAYEIRIEADESITLQNVLLGEVWLCSGQSNMQMPVKGYKNQPVNSSMDILMDAENPYIRLFEVERNSVLTPVSDIKGNWMNSTLDNVNNFSVVAFVYGKRLYEKLNVPIGLIGSYWGGSSAEAWMSTSALEDYPSLDPSKQENQEKSENHIPGALHNGMIKPIQPYSIRGVIWYQGESNHLRAQQYAELFTDLIRSWRQEWGRGDFPFYFVQIAPYVYDGDNSSAFLRESQLKTMQNVSNTGMAVTLDIGKKYTIHPPEKIKVGERLAYWALANTYGMKGLPYAGPVYKSIEIKNNKVHLYFEHAPGGFSTFGKELNDFTVAGANKKFLPAKAEITADEGIVVWNNEISNPKAVRYCFEDWCTGSLYNAMGLPASSFRTDSWDEVK